MTAENAPVHAGEKPTTTEGQSFAEWLEPKLGLLKSVLTERAFVCFLTGRDYLEALHRARRDPSGVLHTLFSDFFFLQYMPGELHEFVRSVLVHEPASEKLAPYEERDLAIAPFVILFQAQLQPIDVRRRLSELCDKDASIDLGVPGKPSEVRPRERVDVTTQVAIELVLEGAELKNRLEHDSHFALLAIDALYYIVRAWRQGESDIDISSDAISKYVADRMTPAGRAGGIPETDRKMLYAAVHELVENLIDPARLRKALVDSDGTPAAWLLERCRRSGASLDDANKAANHVIAQVPQTTSEGFIIRSDERPTIRWQCDAFGRPLAGREDLERIESACSEFDELIKVDKELSVLVGISLEFLSAECGLFQPPETWSTAVLARRRLEVARLGGGAYSQLPQDVRSVVGYVDSVDEALPAIERVFSLSDALRGKKPLAVALQAIGDMLGLKTLPTLMKRRAIEEALRDARTGSGLTETALPNATLQQRSHVATQALFFATDEGPRLDLAKVEREYWQIWGNRLLERLRGRGEQSSVHWVEIARAIERNRTPTLLQQAWTGNTASAWTDFALAAATARKASDGETYPIYFAAAALAILGLSPLALAWERDRLPPEWISALHEGRSSPLAVIVAKRRGSPVWQWRLSALYGQLVVTPESLPDLARTFEGAWSPSTDRHAESLRAPLLLIEADASDVTDRSARNPTDILIAGGMPATWLELCSRARIASVATSMTAEERALARSDVRVITAAASVEDAASQVFAESVRSRTQ